MNRRWIAAAALLAAACGSNGPTPITNPPQIACPADVTVQGVTAPSQPVSFDLPTASGGTAPVNVTCAQSSGSTFPLGTTPVNCTARDGAGRQAACTFNVVLKGMALGATAFLTVGDSLKRQLPFRDSEPASEDAYQARGGRAPLPGETSST